MLNGVYRAIYRERITAKEQAEQEILELRLSSLNRYVEAMGGKLTVDVQLPDDRHIGMNFVNTDIFP